MIDTYYLGTHIVSWLRRPERRGVPLFVSRRRLAEYKTLPQAVDRWALDSGGFTEIAMHGRWILTAKDYVALVRRFIAEVGMLDWAAIQDWMCEEKMLKRTGLSIREHQRRSVDSFLRLRDLAPEVPWTPVLQGFTVADYQRCVDLYDRAGVDLKKEQVVGVGSVCRRQGTQEIATLFHELARAGLRLHGFGVKIRGLEAVILDLRSADSMAWSFDARYDKPIKGHTHKNCANCLEAALRWYRRVRGLIDAAKPVVTMQPVRNLPDLWVADL